MREYTFPYTTGKSSMGDAYQEVEHDTFEAALVRYGRLLVEEWTYVADLKAKGMRPSLGREIILVRYDSCDIDCPNGLTEEEEFAREEFYNDLWNSWKSSEVLSEVLLSELALAHREN